jgi:tetratricopeptide (TPR) repeat protein
MSELLSLPYELTLPPVSPARHLRVVEPESAEEQAQASVAEAEEHGDAGRFNEALAALSGVDFNGAGPRIRVRAFFAEARALMNLGRLDEAQSLVRRAQVVVETPGFTDTDRAEALFRTGCVEFKRSTRVAAAISLFTLALEVCNREAVASAGLRVEILCWRSRAYQIQRDLDAAGVDAENALALAEELGDHRLTAHANFQASLVMERRGDTLLARYYAENARGLYEELGDQLQLGRVLNNLGGITFLLGDAAAAVGFLEQAFAIAVEADSKPDAAQAISSLAQVHLRSGAPLLAEEEASRALDLLEGRVDFLDEIGSAQLVRGRALTELGRLDEAFAAVGDAERSFEQFGSPSHIAAAWVARADALKVSGDLASAADLYRRAAEALQDVKF